MRTVFACLLGFICLANGVALAGEKVDWEKMTTVDRKKYMQDTVLPEMKKRFVAVDANRFADMKCETCHGPKPAETNFTMPNPALPKLPPPMDRAGYAALHQKNPAMAKFMGNDVKPAMAALLGLEPWSPTNTNGFGCYSCHTQQTAGAAAPEPKAGKEPKAEKDPTTKAASGMKEAKLIEKKPAKRAAKAATKTATKKRKKSKS